MASTRVSEQIRLMLLKRRRSKKSEWTGNHEHKCKRRRTGASTPATASCFTDTELSLLEHAHSRLLNNGGAFTIAPELRAKMGHPQTPTPFLVPSRSRRESLVHTAVKTLYELWVVCCVCDAWTTSSCSDLYDLQSLPSTFWTNLKPDPNAPPLPHTLLQDYSIAAAFPRTQGLLLSPRGVEQKKLRLCRQCHRHLEARVDDHSILPPKTAIANGFFVGLLPEPLFTACSVADFVVTTPCRALARVLTVRGGQRLLKGHVHTTEIDLPTVINALPLTPDEAPLKVIITGAMTPTWKALAIKPYVVSKQNITKLITFYSNAKNPHFKGACILQSHNLQ